MFSFIRLLFAYTFSHASSHQTQTETYKMIETCDPNIASWTEDGEMFTVKNPELFASEVC